MKVIGVESGLANTGIAVIEKRRNRYCVLKHETIRTSSSATHAHRDTQSALELRVNLHP